METKILVTCPVCGHKEVLRRPLIYYDLMIHEDIFTYSCPNCHHNQIVETPVIINYQNQIIAFDPDGYHFSFLLDYFSKDVVSARLTTTLSSFVEKQLILKNKYNDIAIEAYKHSFYRIKKAVLFYNDEPTDCFINIISDPLESYLFSQTHYDNMINNPLINKLIKYDTPLSVDQNYIEKLSSRTITTANIKVDNKIETCILPCFLEANIYDEALFYKNGNMLKGEIVSIQEEDLFNIRSSIKIKEIIKKDDDENFLKTLKHVHDTNKDFEDLISIMCDMHVYIPFYDEKPYYMNIHPERCLPVFTKKESILECFPHVNKIVKTKFITLLYLDIFNCDGFLMNPQMDSIFFVDLHFINVLKDYLIRPIS